MNNVEFVAKKGDVLVLENDELQLVLDTIEYEGYGYLILVKTAKHIFDDSYTVNLNAKIIAKEIVENDSYSLEIIHDIELIKKIIKR